MALSCFYILILQEMCLLEVITSRTACVRTTPLQIVVDTCRSHRSSRCLLCVQTSKRPRAFCC